MAETGNKENNKCVFQEQGQCSGMTSGGGAQGLRSSEFNMSVTAYMEETAWSSGLSVSFVLMQSRIFDLLTC